MLQVSVAQKAQGSVEHKILAASCPGLGGGLQGKRAQPEEDLWQKRLEGFARKFKALEGR